jgi:hypothetical protein
MSRLLFIDAECNDLGGRAFAVALLLTDERGEVDHRVLRCPMAGEPSHFVRDNVLPALADVPDTCPDYPTMLAGLRQPLTSWPFNSGAAVLAHVAWPVEARLLLDVFPGDQVWFGPYPLQDVATLLLAVGENPTSVDDYLARHGITPPPGSPHHPLYDCRAADLCARHILARLAVANV